MKVDPPSDKLELDTIFKRLNLMAHSPPMIVEIRQLLLE